MSLTRAQWGLSNPVQKPWLITVIVIVMTVWPTLGNLVSTYVDAIAVVPLLAMICVQQRSIATASPFGGPSRPAIALKRHA